MCWSFNFGFAGNKKSKGPSSSEKKKKPREQPVEEVLHGHGRLLSVDVSEKRRSRESTKGKRSSENVTRRTSRHEREERRPRSQRYHDDVYQRRESRRPSLNVQVPQMYHRSIVPEESNSSQEALLNPRPRRSPHTRQHHPRRTSQTTLRGRGAKRDPPQHSKSKKNLRTESSRGWSLFSPTPSKTPKPNPRAYQSLSSPARTHRSSQPGSTPESVSSSPRHQRSRQHDRSATSSRQTGSSTPNTVARRVPDRRFAVLAATNQALENVRREAFAHASPPPRRERLRRYDGVTIPTSTIPFNWDCVSNSQVSGSLAQTAGGHGESRSRQRRSPR